jgi:hypothetical protein
MLTSGVLWFGRVFLRLYLLKFSMMKHQNIFQITCEHSTRNPPSLTLMCVCVLKLSFSSLFPISILIQLFRCLEVVNTFCLSMIIRTRPRLWRQSELACQFVGGKLYIYMYLFYFLQCTHWFLLSIFWKFHFPFGQSKLYFSLSSFFSQYIREKLPTSRHLNNWIRIEIGKREEKDSFSTHTHMRVREGGFIVLCSHVIRIRFALSDSN